MVISYSCVQVILWYDDNKVNDDDNDDNNNDNDNGCDNNDYDNDDDDDDDNDNDNDNDLDIDDDDDDDDDAYNDDDNKYNVHLLTICLPSRTMVSAFEPTSLISRLTRKSRCPEWYVAANTTIASFPISFNDNDKCLIAVGTFCWNISKNSKQPTPVILSIW